MSNWLTSVLVCSHLEVIVIHKIDLVEINFLLVHLDDVKGDGNHTFENVQRINEYCSR